MPLYFVPIFAQRFGASFLDLGFIGSASALTYTVGPIIVGHLADRVNRSRIYSVAVLINFIAMIMLAFSRSVTDIILIRSLGGLGSAFLWPTTEIMALDLAPRQKRVKEMGLYSVSWGSAFLIGPLIGGIIIQNFGFLILFAISSGLMILAFFQTVGLVTPDHWKTGGRKIRASEEFHLMRQLLPWYVMITLYAIIFGIVTTILPGYANSVGVTTVLVGVLFTAFGISRVVTYGTVEHYLHFGEKKALIAVSLGLSAGCFAIPLFPEFGGFLLIMVLLGGCFAIFFPVTMGLISRHFPDESVGAAVGSYESIYGFGTAIGPILAGAVAISDVRLSFIIATLSAILMVITVSVGKTYSKS
jgi:MFS family permease